MKIWKTMYMDWQLVTWNGCCAHFATTSLTVYLQMNGRNSARVKITIVCTMKKYWIHRKYCENCRNWMHVENIAHVVPMFKIKWPEGSENMTEERHNYAKMPFCGTLECSKSSDSFHNLQRHQKRGQYENEERGTIFRVAPYEQGEERKKR